MYMAPNFLSWIEYNGKVFYLNDDSLKTEKGKKLFPFVQKTHLEMCDLPQLSEISSFNSIREFYPELGDLGNNITCDDFTSPKNFPPKIVRDIKAGKFKWFGISPDLLHEDWWFIYGQIAWTLTYLYKNKIEIPAKNKYHEKVSLAEMELEIQKTEKKWDYHIMSRPPGWDEYRRSIDAAQTEYDEATQPKDAQKTIILRNIFWKIFRNKENRNPVWR